MLSLIILLLEALGLFLIVRYAYRKWTVADLQEKEARLNTLEHREKEMERIKRSVKSDPKSVRQKIDDFFDQLGDV
jgi:hypothetical protein